MGSVNDDSARTHTHTHIHCMIVATQSRGNVATVCVRTWHHRQKANLVWNCVPLSFRENSANIPKALLKGHTPYSKQYFFCLLLTAIGLTPDGSSIVHIYT
jgi:hypothetical protein